MQSILALVRVFRVERALRSEWNVVRGRKTVGKTDDRDLGGLILRVRVAFFHRFVRRAYLHLKSRVGLTARNRVSEELNEPKDDSRRLPNFESIKD